MELIIRKDEFIEYGLVKLGNAQKYTDPKWKEMKIENFWYHKFIIKSNKQTIYVLDKKHYIVGKGWDQHPPVKITHHRNGNLTIKFSYIKSEIGDVYLF